MNSYFVCITISRRHISFEYHQEGASKSLAPFPADETWPVPLALYCTPSKIEIGQAAERAAFRGVNGAYKEWFKHLSTGETLSYLGQQQPVSHLLLLAAEEQFRRFLKDVRYNMDGGLENCRASMPIVLNFEDDVDDSMRIFIANLFKNMGYGRVYEFFHNRAIASYYGSMCPTENLLIIDSDGVDLTLSFYVRGKAEEKIKRVLINAGMDPRLHSLSNMIWDKTGAEYSFLDRLTEQPRLEQMAAEIISANQIEYEGTMHYSNGERLSFIVTRSELVASASGSKSVASDVISFLDKEAGVNPKDVTVVLRNFAAKSDYFSQVLNAEFPFPVIHEDNAIEGTNKIIVRQVIPWLNAKPEQLKTSDPVSSTPPHLMGSLKENNFESILKEMNKKWRQIKAEANGKSRGGQTEDAILMLKNFLSECETIAGTNDICVKIKEEISKMPAGRDTDKDSGPDDTIIDFESIDSDRIKRFVREWREVRASAKGKTRNGDSNEAKSILNTFLQKISEVVGTEALRIEVRKELDIIMDTSSSKSPHSKPSISASSKPQKKTQVPSHPQCLSEGEALIKAGKLKDARDWYRNHNYIKKAGLLTDIIRSKKGIDLRQNSLDEYRKSKNKDQIIRIVKEIEEFIDLCIKVSMPCDNYRKLLNDYKKI